MAKTTHYVNYPTGGCAVLGKWDLGRPRGVVYRRTPKPQPIENFRARKRTPAAAVRDQLVIQLMPHREGRYGPPVIAAMRVLNNLNLGTLPFASFERFMDLCRRSAKELQMAPRYAEYGIEQIEKHLKPLVS